MQTILPKHNYPLEKNIVHKYKPQLKLVDKRSES